MMIDHRPVDQTGRIVKIVPCADLIKPEPLPTNLTPRHEPNPSWIFSQSTGSQDNKPVECYPRTGLTHGVRRVAEMREVAKTVGVLGLPAAMSTATVGWMEMAAQSGVKSADTSPNYTEIGDRLLAVIQNIGSEEEQLEEMSVG